MDITEANIVKIILPFIFSFVIGIFITPILTKYLYRNKMWKKRVKAVSLDGGTTPIFASLHSDREVGTPRMGGIIIWISTLITAFIFWLLNISFLNGTFSKFDFMSKNQTLIPLFVLLLGAIVGLIDDVYEIKDIGSHYAGGLSLKKRLLFVGMISLIISFWFYFKLDVHTINLLFLNGINFGLYFIPLFVLITLFIYSGGIIDGIDGLAGGVFASIFIAYSAIAFFQNQINLAAFCSTLVGSILAFLWFNIPPARFYMSETGSMSLTLTLAIVAFMTDTIGGGKGIAVLPIIAFPLFATSLSVIAQIISKKFRKGKKIFLAAPVHHHFEAKGWSAPKVAMRYWLISIVCAVFGVILAQVK